MTLDERLERIDAMLVALIDRQPLREWYSVEEFARIVERSEFTCRAWCRRGRVRGQKKSSGRGAHMSWAISNEELQRYQREGLRRVSAAAMHLTGHTRPRDDNQGL
ncbi:MAG: hypothetical protein K2X87_08195 [Gemmataceae bacterium]|nr:hypothetical protein [Gemmataceae bacterium]